MGTQSTWATCVRYINTTNTNTTNKRTNNTMNTMKLSKSVNVASKTVQRSRPAVVAVRAVNLPFGLGGSKTAAPKKTAGGRGSQKVTTSDPAAQSFVIRIPGQFFQSKKDVVWPISLGFTKANELFVGRMAMLGFAASRQILRHQRTRFHKGERALRRACRTVGFRRLLDRGGHHGTGTSRAVQPRDRYSTSRRRASSPLLHRPPRPHRGKRGNWKVRRRRVNSSIHYIIFAIILLNPQAQSKVCSIVSPTFL